MQNNIVTLHQLRSIFCCALAVCVLILSDSLASAAQPALKWPTGAWDVVVGGDEQGTAYLEFSSDFRLRGTEIITHMDPEALISGTDSTAPKLFYYGRFPIEGSWGFDNTGRVIGFFKQGGDKNYNTASRGVSFTAVVTPGVKLTLTAVHGGPNPDDMLPPFSPPLKCVYVGIPLAKPKISINGSWQGIGAVRPITDVPYRFTEFFKLTSIDSALKSDPNYFANHPEVARYSYLAGTPATFNFYLMTATAANYTSDGLAFLSNQKRISFVFRQKCLSTERETIKAVTGPILINPTTGICSGIWNGDIEDTESAVAAIKLIYNANRLPAQ